MQTLTFKQAPPEELEREFRKWAENKDINRSEKEILSLIYSEGERIAVPGFTDHVIQICISCRLGANRIGVTPNAFRRAMKRLRDRGLVSIDTDSTRRPTNYAANLSRVIKCYPNSEEGAVSKAVAEIVGNKWRPPSGSNGKTQPVVANGEPSQPTRSPDSPWSEARAPAEWQKHFGISPTTWRKWVEKGLIRVQKRTTKSVRVAIADLDYNSA